MARRDFAVPVDKMTIPEILDMVAKSNDDGWGVPAQVIIDVSNKRTLAKLFDSGLLEMHKSNAMGGYYYYSITEAGRAKINS